jgi:iron complex outermembrane receptor protein
LGRWGFRLDWDVSDQNSVTLQGDAYRGEVNQVFGTFDPTDTTNFFRVVKDEFEVVGGNILGRWTTSFSPESDLRVQAYYDRTERNITIFSEKRDTFDIDFQHRFPLGRWNDVVWGLGYRLTSDHIGNSPTISLLPDDRTLNLYSGFVQDEISLVPDKLQLTLGSKFEHNDFTGVEIQPSGRLIWTPTEHQSAWASVSRAVRTPSRAEEDVRLNSAIPAGALFPGSPTAISTIFGNGDLDSEKLLAYEIGYRIQPHKNLSFDLAAFYNDYDDLRSIELGFSPTQGPTPPPGPAPFVPMYTANKLYGETYGFEGAATWEVTPWWRLQPNYTWLQMQLHKRAGSTDTRSEQDEGRSPHHQFSLRSSMDFPHAISLDCTLRFVDTLPALQIDSYLQLDVRIA